MEARHIAALEAAVLDLDAAATPTRSDVFTACGVHAADLRDAIKAALAASCPIPAEPVAWMFEYLGHCGDGEDPTWETGVQVVRPKEGRGFHYRDIRPLYAAPPAPAPTALAAVPDGWGWTLVPHDATALTTPPDHVVQTLDPLDQDNGAYAPRAPAEAFDAAPAHSAEKATEGGEALPEWFVTSVKKACRTLRNGDLNPETRVVDAQDILASVLDPTPRAANTQAPAKPTAETQTPGERIIEGLKEAVEITEGRADATTYNVHVVAAPPQTEGEG